MSGIYIHIPFCKQACHYCDFHFSTSLKKKKELLSAMAKELQLRKNEFENQTIETIYFGGGTPSLLAVEELQILTDAIYKNYTVSTDPEITLEANPDDLVSLRHPGQASGLMQSSTVFRDLKGIGVNRLSIGIQSFFDDDLKAMNRAHSAHHAKICLEEARSFFDNVTIDLIYGMPDMDLKKWNANLDMAFAYEINHISSYALTVEPKTALDHFIKQGKYPPLDDHLALEHFRHLIERSEKQGFLHYELSNFGRPNYFSKHNTSYWQGKPYLGIGPSAHSFKENQRSWNVSNNTEYIKAIQGETLPRTVENLSLTDRYNESVMIGLRTMWGVSLKKIERDFGVDYAEHLERGSQKFIDSGLLQMSVPGSGVKGSDRMLKTTPKGKFLIDGMASDLFVLD
ncbi:radical SAM family heme chaperone HemW [Aestuariivivens sediminicola]|uniref:radical SAM family heme chaperone HemW n=1 Tax=Aestuariivivens sediminicola TaxID=2913560 RepID=UPI001F59AE58|nr:radical SAM family heme chaperone HemW [Aestuariivivens sediminicola]